MIPKKNEKKKLGQVSFDGKDCWVGVDVHKVNYAVAILDEDGQRLEFSTVADPKRLLLKLFKMGMRIKVLAYESGPTGYGLAWACQENGIPVVVAAPSRIPRPVSKTGKTDRLDSMKLAEYLVRDMLKGIAVPSREEFALREMERARQRLVKRRRVARQIIRSFLLRNGLEEPSGLDSWSASSIQALRGMPLPVYLRLSLDSYLEEHATILAALSTITEELAKATIEQGHGERVKNLRSIPGVGVTIAHTFTSEVFRPERFTRAEDICAYVGLAPTTSHSGSGIARAALAVKNQGRSLSFSGKSAYIFH